MFVFEWAAEAPELKNARGMRANGVRVGVASDHKMVMADNMSIFFCFKNFVPNTNGVFLFALLIALPLLLLLLYCAALLMKFALSFDVFAMNGMLSTMIYSAMVGLYSIFTSTYLVRYYLAKF